MLFPSSSEALPSSDTEEDEDMSKKEKRSEGTGHGVERQCPVLESVSSEQNEEASSSTTSSSSGSSCKAEGAVTEVQHRVAKRFQELRQESAQQQGAEAPSLMAENQVEY